MVTDLEQGYTLVAMGLHPSSTATIPLAHRYDSASTPLALLRKMSWDKTKNRG